MNSLGRVGEVSQFLMDPIPIRAALSDLERALDSARDARYQIECERTNRRSVGGFEEPELALPGILNQIKETLLVVLEAAGLSQTRERLLQKWTEFEKKGGIGKTDYDGRFDYLESLPLSFVEQMIDNLRACAGEAISTKDSHDLALLERLLRNTAVLVRKRKIKPKKERDVRDVMHDYLEASFTEYRRDVRIHGIVRDFNPDGGVRNLKAAIEYKFADSQREVAKAIGGIFEDISGYSGSLDWIRFYSVIYQTEAFESEDRIKSEMTRAGTLVTWKTFLVTGAGERPRGASMPRAT
jgi:hypothetical protein